MPVSAVIRLTPYCAGPLSHCIGLVASCIIMTSTASGQETQLLWGDLHVHTNMSQDAYPSNQGVSPEMAYRFARGIPIYYPNLDTKIKIDRPLDFMAVTDHAVSLGIDLMIRNESALLTQSEWGRRLVAEANSDGAWPGLFRYQVPAEFREQHNALTTSVDIKRSNWQIEIDAAENNYIPGTFTTFFAWEWTSLSPSPDGLKNLHRNVISNADAFQAASFIPFSNQDSIRPEDLWNFLEQTEARTGTDFVAIPHNSNLSGGLMFDDVDSDGRPLNAAYASDRMRWELLVEITQVKGTSEIHPALAPTDEFADYEIRRKLLAGQPTHPNPSDYVRTALVKGIGYQQSLQANPYKFGIIGATDSHIGVTSVEEGNFLGKMGWDTALSERPLAIGRDSFPAWEMSASGLTGVWATENTREAIFAAFKRRETYATTGPRISLRVFGGFVFEDSDAMANDIAEVGYRKGVPMGSDLVGDRRRRPVSLLIHAAKDPVGANLDRIQVVKGWIDAEGNQQSAVFDVAWSDGREPDANGKIPAVDNTVDTDTAFYTNDSGAAQLAVVWTDPQFNYAEHAVYYVRAIEIPTPRHSLYDALALGIPVAETGQPATIQERAYSSPIWYTP
jgi:hypothetical protein